MSTIDCGRKRRTWGCGCLHCRDRNHPLDRIARFSDTQKEAWAAMQAEIAVLLAARPKGKCVSCTRDGRLYAGGRFCDAHAPGRRA